MPEAPSVEGSESRGADQPIFVSDASAEAERLTETLRQRGYVVIDVPLGLLVGRFAAQRPSLILCDADAAGALDTIARLREVRGGETVDVIFFGEAGRTLSASSDVLFHEASGSFVRPVDVEVLLRKIEALIGAPQERPRGSLTAPPSRSPVLLPTTRKPYRYEGNASPGGQQQLALGSAALPTAFEREATGMEAIPESELSFGLVELLREGDARLGELPAAVIPRTRRLPPDAEVEAVLSADVLAALDEELELEEAGLFPNPPTHGHWAEGSSVAGPPEPPGAGSAAPASGLEGSAEAESGRAPPVPSGDAPPTPDARISDARHVVTTPPPQRGSEPILERLRAVMAELPNSSEAFTAVDFGSQPPGSRGGSEQAPVPSAPLTASSLPPASASISFSPPRPFDKPPSSPVARGLRPDSSRVGGGKQDRGSTPWEQVVSLGELVRSRYTGALAVELPSGLRRVVFREGDFVTVASAAPEESLVAFLAQRGSLTSEAAGQLSHRLPHYGRHAGAALVAHGHLRQDELWSVLRAHAEWLLVRLIELQGGRMTLEVEVPERLRDEPAVFGGAAGAEVLVELVRRAIAPERALERLGSGAALIAEGPAWSLLRECALPEPMLEVVRRSSGLSLSEVVSSFGRPLAPVLYALAALSVISTSEGPLYLERRTPSREPEPGPDPLDQAALKERVLARRALVEQGDYFAVLGVARGATDYDIQKAYQERRLELEPVRELPGSDVELDESLELIFQVLEEAHQILSDPVKRERYRRAISAPAR
jgi:hypothetical protein